MKPWQQWVVVLGLVAIGWMLGWGLSTRLVGCAGSSMRAEISKKAATACVTEEIGCSLSLEQIERVMGEQALAEQCRAGI